MEVILLENIRNLGKFGTKVRVANGYGRNFLIPRGKAAPATKDNLANFEAQRAILEKAAGDRLSVAQAKSAEIEAVSVTISARAADEGKLYGSISTLEIAKAYQEKGVKLERQDIRLPNGPIREIGDFEVMCQLHAEVTATAKVSIVPEEG